MGCYRCDDCDVSWPSDRQFTPCPGCGKSLAYRADAAPLSREWAETLAASWRESAEERARAAAVEAQLDEALVAAFTREMDDALGPSTSDSTISERRFPPFPRGL